METIKRLIAWAQRNERHLGAVLFVFGFVGDLFTFAALPLAYANLAFLAYLALALVSTYGSHLFSSHQGPTWRRALSVLAPLGTQYAVGSLLSGCLIFYTKSAAVAVSWPFLLFLIAIFIGNEWFRTYYKYLAFQIVLLFFAIYAYAIFALPLLVHRLGAGIFLASTAISVAVFGIFLGALSLIRRPGFRRSLAYALPGVVGIVAVMNLCYFSGLIPPIPLSLPVAGIYHDIRRENGSYVVSTEGERAWWDLRPRVIHHVPGTPLYGFSSVSAPVEFGASVVHVWEEYDPKGKEWQTRNWISFPISGGRDGGYRGYSEVSDPEPGTWRLTIETASHQVIGRVYFTVLDAATPPVTHDEQR
jgi:hypothetical protein